MRKLIAIALFTMLPLLGADFAGSWKGQFKVKTPDGMVVDEGSAVLDLKQTGGTVTGTATAGEDSLSIQDGKADGDVLTFKVRNGDAPEMQVKLTMTNGALVGQAPMEIDGRKVVAELRFERK